MNGLGIPAMIMVGRIRLLLLRFLTTDLNSDQAAKLYGFL